MMQLVMGVAKMITICYGWQVKKMSIYGSFEHFANNSSSHYAWCIACTVPGIVEHPLQSPLSAARYIY